TLERKGGNEPLDFHYTRMVNAGYVGRNQDEVRRHINELAEKGIPGPKKVPTLYPVIPRTLLTDSEIEVYGDETCGEVEYVLLIENPDAIYVGVGSDHTDRHLEETDIPRAKQICPNIISGRVWPLAEVMDHWDDLAIEASVVKKGKEILYQQGLLALIMDPKALLKFVASKVPPPLEGLIIYSGTLGSLTGGFVFGEEFLATLTDPKLGRSLDLRYKVLPMHYMTVE
ncbi:MAG: DUF2848 family protein, partial [Deltaproteobacteria bacterium]